MQRQIPFIPQLQLKNLQIHHQSLNSKTTSRGLNTHRNLVKTYLSRETLQQCLSTFDIFKEIIEDPLQFNKLIRDVGKKIHLKIYQEQTIIYNNGDSAQSIYMVIKGAVSLCLRTIRETKNEEQQNVQINQAQQQVQYDYQQVACFQDGEGFGQVEFIHQTKRNLVAKVKTDQTVLGIIDGRGFEQIIEMYRQRVYYKKKDMFIKCPLLKMLQPYQIEFIVNNAKPVTFTISKQIVEMNEVPKYLYLIMDGQVQLREQTRKQKPELIRYSIREKNLSDQQYNNKIKIKNLVVGILEQGAFLGDCQLALNHNYKFTAVCKSEKVKAYMCDERIIMSQMNEQSFQFAQRYYRQKYSYRENKIVVFREAKQKIQKQLQTCEVIELSRKQLQIKRKIMNRYVQKTPTFIGQLSPREISKMVDKKYKKIKSEPNERMHFPSLNEIKMPQRRLIRNQRAFSPLLKRYQQLRESKQSYLSQQSKLSPTRIKQASSSPRPKRVLEMPLEQIQFVRSNSRPLLIYLRPFQKRVQSLHQRLARQYLNVKKKKEKELVPLRKMKTQNQYSIVQSKRIFEFINKVKMHIKKESNTII